MAKRRMISVDINTSQWFINLTGTQQSLLDQLTLAADDDGFCGAMLPMYISHANDDDIQALINAGFIYLFPGKICLVRHWKLIQTIQSDRYHETLYKKEKAAVSCVDDIYILNENGVDNPVLQNVSTMETVCNHSDNRSETQPNLMQSSINDNITEYSINDKSNTREVFSKENTINRSLENDFSDFSEYNADTSILNVDLEEILKAYPWNERLKQAARIWFVYLAEEKHYNIKYIGRARDILDEIDRTITANNMEQIIDKIIITMCDGYVELDLSSCKE